ncbi:hypothetical protein ACU52_02110 [Xylanibacter rarus]|uniref:Uncharacterized protein n=1 Tax=Xylanibacter rarus TaxID=1676614 RepID=A0A8E1R0V4_9BACT|nr:hypothetical protein ACU52_02110 [Xylanibacter rarus]
MAGYNALSASMLQVAFRLGCTGTVSSGCTASETASKTMPCPRHGTALALLRRKINGPTLPVFRKKSYICRNIPYTHNKHNL